MPVNAIVTNTAASTSGIERATTGARAQPQKLNKLTPRTMAIASPKTRLHEVGHRVLDGNRLVGEEERRLDPNGQVGLDLGHGVLDVAPEGEDVAARSAWRSRGR